MSRQGDGISGKLAGAAHKKKEVCRIEKESSFSRACVDIIIPFHGQYEKVVGLIESVWKVTRSNPYQICLVDDASPNNDFISKFESERHRDGYYENQILPIRSAKRLGFGGALRLGFESTKQPWVCFLNSDCVVENSSWLIEMGRSLLRLKEHNVRMVSARSDNPGEGYDCRLKGLKNDDTEEDIVLNEKDPPLPFYCTMCHRQLFDRIGGFVKSYPYGMYEDEELAYRMRHHKFSQGISAKSWVHHAGGLTFEALLKSDKSAAAIIEENRNRCIEDMRKLK